MVRHADFTIITPAGPEIGVASTKAFTGQVTIFNLIGILLAQKKGCDIEEIKPIINDLDALPGLVQTVLDKGNEIL